MLSFYGGPNGQSFEIAWIFATKTGAGNSMETDINMGWKSPIEIGAYVVISYGEPDTQGYEDLQTQDLEADKKSYNSTLWQKVYDETQNEYNGINYRLIMSMAGFTPRIEFVRPIKVLDADQPPDIIYDRTDLTKPKITLCLPQAQVLQLGTTQTLDADQMPYHTYDDETDVNRPVLTFYLPQSQIMQLQPTVVLNADEMPDFIYDDESDINKPKLTFKLPQSQRIKLGTITWLKANEDPSVTIDSSNINEPKINFNLPVAQELQQGAITVLDADEDPYFEIDSSDPDNPVLKFFLPQSQVMQDPGLVVLDSTKEPSISMDSSDINAPKITFSLPRTVKYFYGNLLGKRLDGTYEIENTGIEDCWVGDYYINDTTGFVYQCTNLEGTTLTFKFVACIQQPLPDVRTTQIAPYTAAAGTQSEPYIEKHYTNDEHTTWELEFFLPKSPLADIETNYVGSTEVGTSSVEIKDENTLKFNFKIPTGTKFFAGQEISAEKTQAEIEGARIGDLYLNTKDGKIYELMDAENNWTAQDGSIIGPIGDALHIVDHFVVEGEDEFQPGVDAIEEKYSKEEITCDELYSVTFTGTEDGTVCYWYFIPENNNGEWARVLLTGNFIDIIKSEYKETSTGGGGGTAFETYSIDYLNKTFEEAKSVYCEATLTTTDWSGQTGAWTQTITNEKLNYYVPPLISPVSNIEEYSKLTEAVVKSTTSLEFKTREKPNNDIKILILNVR